jgi:hypothetical protein
MYHFANIFYKMRKFGSDQAIMKGTLLIRRKYLLRWITSSIQRIFPETSYLAFCEYAVKMCKFVCYWSVMKGNLLVEQHTFSSVSHLPFKGFS